MLEDVAHTVQRLKTADSFDAGAPIALAPMLARVTEALAAHGIGGRALRGVAVLREADGYRALGVLELDSAEVRVEEQLASSHVWRWIARHERPVSVDVLFGRARRVDDPEVELSTATHPGGSSFEQGPSREMWMARGTTHLLVLPLCDERSVLRGMVSLEVQARGATRMEQAWAECVDAVGGWLDLVGPYLCALEARGEETGADPLLPVCGETMAPIVKLVRVFAAQDETLSFSGATGVGKSRMAHFCHARSRRAGGPFETVDLLSVPPTMQTAELYGWRKGAFTGADRDHEGYVARARGGSLFLDEIDKLSLDAQASLLRLLETRRYRPLGEGTDREADVRFLVGTNADLLAEVREGRFREDLYYRVQVLAVHLPPLSQRVDEVVPWAEHMLERRQEAVGGRPATLSEEARALLRRARWPGNLRQLDNAVRRAVVLAEVDADPRGLLRVEAAHVQASLVVGGPSGDSRISGALAEAARGFVDAVRGGAALSLDDAAIFRAHVLAAAIAATGELEAALVLLGRENLVKQRNHQKTLARELERVQELYAAIGEPPPAWLLETLRP